MKMGKVLVALILVFIFGCSSGKKPTVPDDLIGVWKTSDAKYAGRSFEINKDKIIFGTGEGNFETYAIKKIEIEKVAGEVSSLYTLYHDIEGQEYKFSFHYDPTHLGAIRFKNQDKIVWTKEKS